MSGLSFVEVFLERRPEDESNALSCKFALPYGKCPSLHLLHLLLYYISMQADIEVLFRSPLLQVLDIHCRETPGTSSAIEYSPDYEITFTRTGYFGFQAGKQNYAVDICSVLLDNARTEHVVTHGREVRDICTVLKIPEHLLHEACSLYWKSSSGFAIPKDTFVFPFPVIRSTAGLDSLHLYLLQSARNHLRTVSTLKLEELELELIQELFALLYGPGQAGYRDPGEKERQQYLEMIERAKHYMTGGFDQELSLVDISRQAHSSVFHFSRIFKRFTSYSPYQYLMELRLKHAEMLLKNTSLPVTEICFSSGFNSLAHFIATFTRHHGLSPSRYRIQPRKRRA